MARGKTTTGNKATVPTEKVGAAVAEIKDDAKVTVICSLLAGNKTSIDGEITSFDEEGKAEVSGKLAKYFLSCSKAFTVKGYDQVVKPEVKEEPVETQDEKTDSTEE